MSEEMTVEEMDLAMKEFKRRIDDDGLAVVGSMGSREAPTVVYTLGLDDINWPELVVIGDLPPPAMEMFIHKQIAAWREAKQPSYGVQVLPLPELGQPEYKVHTRLVSPIDACMSYTGWIETYHKSSSVKVAQIIFPDANGNFPMDEGYDQGIRQPLIAPVKYDEEPSSEIIH